MSDNTQQVEKTELVSLGNGLYGVRENLTVDISQRNWGQKAKGNKPWEAQAVFEDKKARQSVVLWLPVLQQIAGFCGHAVANPVTDWGQELRGERYKDKYTGFVKHDYAPDDAYKYYRWKSGSEKLEVTIYENARIEVAEKYYSEEPKQSVDILLADVLAVLDLIELAQVNERKEFQVGDYTVKVTSQDMPGDEKPLQVQIQTEIEGIIKTVTGSYPESASANRDENYHDFDEAKAQKFVESFQRFIADPPKAFQE